MTLTDEAASYSMDAQTLQSLRNMGNECEAAADEIQRLRADRDTEEACARLHAGLLREVALALGNEPGDDRSTLPERVRAMRDEVDRLRAALQEADTLLGHDDDATEWRERWAGLWANGGPEDDDSEGGEPDAGGGQDEPKPRGRRARKAAEVG